MLMYESARPKKNKVDLIDLVKNKILQIIKVKISGVKKHKKDTVKQENTSIEYLEIPKTRDIVINQFKLFKCFDDEPEPAQEAEETKDNYTLFKEYILENSNKEVLPSNSDIENNLNISQKVRRNLREKAIKDNLLIDNGYNKTILNLNYNQ